MPDPFVRQLGDVTDIDGIPVTVGVDYDCVVIDARDARLTGAALEEFARLFIAAHWQAAANTVAAALTSDGPDG
jgi:hypothetical protein